MLTALNPAETWDPKPTSPFAEMPKETVLSSFAEFGELIGFSEFKGKSTFFIVPHGDEDTDTRFFTVSWTPSEAEFKNISDIISANSGRAQLYSFLNGMLSVSFHK